MNHFFLMFFASSMILSNSSSFTAFKSSCISMIEPFLRSYETSLPYTPSSISLCMRFLITMLPYSSSLTSLSYSPAASTFLLPAPMLHLSSRSRRLSASCSALRASKCLSPFKKASWIQNIIELNRNGTKIITTISSILGWPLKTIRRDDPKAYRSL